MLKQYDYNDSNTLNTAFYNELLHIIGLEEYDCQGKKLIRRKAQNRDENSFMEGAIYQLEDNISDQELLFETALNLSITWINRILFLKLLESQIISYHPKQKNDYRFLDINTIPDYDFLNELFFKVLAKQHEQRNASLQEKYKHVPYLNSSLFEKTDNEQKYIQISQLKCAKLAIYKQTVLKDETGKTLEGELNTLEYLFRFLDDYDFGSDAADESLTKENAKTLINAAVLGLIFEKINGYKDGSFFTPGAITQYMCHEAIRRSVIEKFNSKNGWDCRSITDLYNKITDLQQANEIVNSIKMCDPAVGSGHFLVSALNEIIAIKNDLGILCDKDGKRLRGYRVVVENDELITYDDLSNIFTYNPQSSESQRVQETLFNEKLTVIEKCLFGADINPNSVNICCLRLWTELLKNAYYIDQTGDLQTLPNIDINIKCGNSLISRFGLDADLKTALRNSKYNITAYQTAVSAYHNTHNKDEKQNLRELINSIKNEFKTEISKKSPLFLRRKKAKDDLFNLHSTITITAFDTPETQKKIKERFDRESQRLAQEIEKYDKLIHDYENNEIFKNAIEWRIEFPEVLDDDGQFVGFDVVVGNPPYIQLQSDSGKLGKLLETMDYKTFVRTGDIYQLFYEKGYQLLSKKGKLCFITSNK